MSTKERFPLHDAPGLVRDEVAALTPHVERLYGDSPVYTTNVRDEDGSVLERLTEHGYRAAKGAEQVALASFALLASATGRHATPTPHHQLLETLQYDAAKLFGVLSAALAGLQGHPDACMATWGMNDLLEELLERCDSDEAREAADFVYRNPAETPDQIEALVERFGPMNTWRERAERAEAEDGENGAGAPTVSQPARSDGGDTTDEPQHVVTQRMLGEGGMRELTVPETREILLDAYRPLLTYLHRFEQLSWEDGDDPDVPVALADAITIAERANVVSQEIHRWRGFAGGMNDLAFLAADLLEFVRYALPSVAALRGEAFVRAAGSIQGCVKSVYKLLAADIEEPAHV